MFVFGEDGPPRRLGLPGIVVLVLLAVGVVAAVRWHPAARTPGRPSDADIRTAEIRAMRESGDIWGCMTGVLIYVKGETPSPQELQQMIQDSQVQNCTVAIAAQPQRALLSPSDRWDGQAKAVHAAMDRVLCPPDCRDFDPNNPTDRRPVTDADVAEVRHALDVIGHPEADVRPVQSGDGGPPDTVMYGVPLGHDACAVSYAANGLRPGPLGAVGALSGGRCLSPAEPVPAN